MRANEITPPGPRTPRPRAALSTLLGGAFTAATLLCGAPVLAQQGTDPREAAEDDATFEFRKMPDWSIKKEVDRLDNSMQEYSSLINSLSRASKDLGEEFEKYLKDPHNELLASSVERKMAIYAKTVRADFNDIIADQDVLGANFRELQRKLVVFSDHLGGQARGFKVRLDNYRTTARDHEKKLLELSVRIRENPPSDERELAALKREFAKEFRRYRLQGRYVSGYERRFQSYQALEKNMKSLAGMFVNLHEKFNELIENLENERQYLDDSIRLQADKIRIQQIIRQGVLGSEQAIGNVADKLANLYNKVDAFSQVHERINSDLNQFVQSQGTLMDVTKRIDAIGAAGGPIGDLAGDMEKAIDLFYKQSGEPTGDRLLLEDVKETLEAEQKQAEAGAPAPEGAAAPRSQPTTPAPSPLSNSGEGATGAQGGAR